MNRYMEASKASFVHFLISCFVAISVALFVFLVWYPHPFSEISGGKSLFIIVIMVDVICGPMLTLVIFNPKKSKRELISDLLIVGIIQLAAMGYGLLTVWTVRPVYLIHEIDRFKVVTYQNIDKFEAEKLPADYQPSWRTGPKILRTNANQSAEIKSQILLDSMQGGRDFAEHVEYYVSYSSSEPEILLKHAKSISIFIANHPNKKNEILKIISNTNSNLDRILYLPVIGRQDWIAILGERAQIIGYVQGDGFK